MLRNQIHLSALGIVWLAIPQLSFSWLSRVCREYKTLRSQVSIQQIVLRRSMCILLQLFFCMPSSSLDLCPITSRCLSLTEFLSSHPQLHFAMLYLISLSLCCNLESTSRQKARTSAVFPSVASFILGITFLSFLLFHI